VSVPSCLNYHAFEAPPSSAQSSLVRCRAVSRYVEIVHDDLAIGLNQKITLIARIEAFANLVNCGTRCLKVLSTKLPLTRMALSFDQ